MCVAWLDGRGRIYPPNGEPAAATATAVLQACLQRNLLLLTCGSYQNVLRWIPPLVVNQQQIDEALYTFEEALVAANAS